MAEVTEHIVSLTDRAVAEIETIREKEQLQADKALRLGVKGGGCSGLSYVLEFDQEKDFDQVYHIKGLKVLVDKRHALYISGMVVDYEHGLNDRGFIFTNPNAKSTCGCGTSFST
jgi:iron-sulfur cluster assembly protein